MITGPVSITKQGWYEYKVSPKPLAAEWSTTGSSFKYMEQTESETESTLKFYVEDCYGKHKAMIFCNSFYGLDKKGDNFSLEVDVDLDCGEATPDVKAVISYSGNTVIKAGDTIDLDTADGMDSYHWFVDAGQVNKTFTTKTASIDVADLDIFPDSRKQGNLPVSITLTVEKDCKTDTTGMMLYIKD